MEKIDYRKMGMEIKIRRLRADISQSDLAKQDRKSTRLNSSHPNPSRMPSSA